jgi:protein phosphatase
MKRYLLDVAGLSDQGVKREHNEDAWSAPHPHLASGQIAAKGQLYVVADGVGGHLAGDVASRMAVEIVQQHYYADASLDAADSLKAAIQAANTKIYQEASTQSARRGMRTTVTAAVFCGGQLTVANVGDSRTYLIRQGAARQLTDDHTWVEEQVKGGVITQEEAKRHPHRNIITRSLGGKNAPRIDVFEKDVGPGDEVLLCSDGLSNLVSDDEIGAIVGRGWTAEAVVKELIALAIERGAPDNVTAVLISIIRQA